MAARNSTTSSTLSRPKRKAAGSPAVVQEEPTEIVDAAGDEDAEETDDELIEVDGVEVLGPEDEPLDEPLVDQGDDMVVEAVGESIELDEGSPFPSRRPATRALARMDPLQLYMQEVQRHPLLTTEEEHELAVEYHRTTDVKVAARLVTANLRLVVKLAYEYRRAYRNIMDLVQEGNIGLMQAVRRYDPYRGVKLSSYAAWWIRAYILRYILNNWRLVKLGTTQAQRKLFFNLNKEKARLTAMGIEPSHAEIAERLNVHESEVIEMDRRLSAGDASLDANVGDADGRPTSRLDLMPAPTAGPDQLSESLELHELVRAELAKFKQTLAGRDLDIFERRLISEEPVTLQQLGDEYGVSRERMRQLEARITDNLRKFLAVSLGDAVRIDG